MNPRSYRSLFWPIVLIGVGVIWLLATLGIIPPVGWYSVLRFWPLLLILIGLDILIGRRWPALGALLGLAAIALVVVLLFAGPRLGLAAGPEVKTERFSAPMDGTTSASIKLNFSSEPVQVYSLTGPENLIDAQISYVGNMRFDVSGGAEKTVTLSEERPGGSWMIPSLSQMDWKIGLSPDIPTDLSLNGGSGSGEIDLSQLKLASLTTDFGSGSMRLSLPAAGPVFSASVQSGSGSVTIQIPQDAGLELRLNSGSGSVTVDVPENAAARLEVQNSGSGSVSTPSGWKQVQKGEDDEGIWEAPAYSASARKIDILVVDLGSGSIQIR